MTHAQETGAINQLHFLVPIYRSVCVRNANFWCRK